MLYEVRQFSFLIPAQFFWNQGDTFYNIEVL